MKRITCVVAMLAMAACGGSSAPSAPSMVQTRAAATAMTFGSFEVATLPPPAGSGDAFARCLQGAADAQCVSASRLRTNAHTGAPATGVPINLSATAIGSSVTLTWIPPTSGDSVLSYIIEAGSTPGTANLANFSTGNTATSFFASGVGNGTYFVRVRAVGASGIGAPSNEAVLVVTGTGCAVVPGAPSGLGIALNSSGTVVLTWSGAAGNPTSYVVEAGSAPGLSNLANSDLGLTTTLTTTGVGVGAYYVRIRARTACGSGPASNEIILVVGSDPATRTDTMTAILSRGEPRCSDGGAQRPCRVYPFHISASGVLQARLTWPEDVDLDLALFRGGILIVNSMGVTNTENLSSTVSPGDYELHVTYYGGSVIANFTLAVTRPN